MRKLQNPIIPGLYPDPSICRVGDDFYLACSSFELCPGIPVFHSKDLANWEQICNAMTQENGFYVEKNSMIGGVMAPTIRWHDGVFYIINANFSDRGNYIITATNPAGPWSEPHWLEDVPGIDASIFFDEDGQAYILGTGDVWDNGCGKKERGIWLAAFDITNFKLAGEPVTIFNSALRVGQDPESPHLYRIGDYYYLMIAEGGTEHYHSVMVARSKKLYGFYEGNPANPVMTHRHMGYKSPIINVGHADFVELQDGSWYAVMLASRLVAGESKILGRETFICPVVWERDWPLFSPQTGKIEWEYDAPESLPWTKMPQEIIKDDFDDSTLQMCWNFWGTPQEDFWKIQNSKLILQCIPQALDEPLKPLGMTGGDQKDAYCAFVGRRQRSLHQTASCMMRFMPESTETAGLALVQALNHQLHIERACINGEQKLQVVLVTDDCYLLPFIPGFEDHTNKEVLASIDWKEPEVVIRIQMNEEKFTVYYGTMDSMQELCKVDGRRVNPAKIGCMSGTVIGMYATGNGKKVENQAEFEWFELT